MSSSSRAIANAKVEQDRRGSISRSKKGGMGTVAPEGAPRDEDDSMADADDMPQAQAVPTHGMLGGFPKGHAVGLRLKRRGIGGQP